MFLLKCTGLKGDYKESMEEITELAIKYEVNAIVEETNFGDGMFAELLKPVLIAKGHPVPIDSVRFTSAQGYKEQRIISVLEPFMNQHRLIVDFAVIEDNLSSVCG